MSPLEAFWHVLNFLVPAVGVGVLSAAMAKVVWRRELAAVPWKRLAVGSTLAGVAALVAGLVVFGRDGKMATYGLLLVCSALALWVAGARATPASPRASSPGRPKSGRKARG